MPERLTRQNLHGIWAAIATPFDANDQFDEGVFRENLRRPTQVGVTWTNTRGMLDRLQHAASRGILGAHVGHPFFMPMTPSSYAAFWRDVQSVVPDWFAL